MTSPNKIWTVVCFCSDESVEAVPTRWINGDECLWPAVPVEKLNMYIKNCEYNSCWPSHKVRSFRNATYDDYKLARAKANKAQTTSDLNTDVVEDTEVQPIKRSRKKKVFSSSDSDEDEPPIIKKKAKKVRNLPPPPSWTDVDDDSIMDVEGSNSNNFEYLEEIPNQHQQSTSSSPLLIHVQPSTFSRTPSRKPLIQVQPISSPRTPVQRIQENMTKTSKGCCCNPRLLYNIQALLLEINSKVGKCNCNQNLKQEVDESILEKSQQNFPISTTENFKEFENFLSITSNYTALIQFFSKLGGINIYEFIKRCIAPILKDTLAEQFSFLGKKGKNTFGTTFLAKAIIEAAEKSGLASNRKETEQKIGDWLRRAKERHVRAELRTQK